jgi:hypothetical protein
MGYTLFVFGIHTGYTPWNLGIRMWYTRTMKKRNESWPSPTGYMLY